MAQHETPVVERIVQDIESRLRGITQNAGYAHNVFVERLNRAGLVPRDGMLVIVMGDREPFHGDNAETGVPFGRIGWMQDIHLVCYRFVREDREDNPQSDLATIAADVESVVMANTTWGGLADDTQLEGAEFWSDDDGSTMTITVHFSFFYQTTVDDPYEGRN
jgi:hypothetical protein